MTAISADENMMNEKETSQKISFKRILPQISVFALSAVATILGIIFLPEKIYVQIFSDSPVPETEKVFFLLAAAAIVGLSASMSIFTDKTKKWFALETVLVLAQVFCVIYNFIVL